MKYLKQAAHLIIPDSGITVIHACIGSRKSRQGMPERKLQIVSETAYKQ